MPSPVRRVTPRRPFLLAASLAVWCASGLGAQTEPAAVGPSFVVNQQQQFTQKEARVATDPGGEVWAVGWHTALQSQIALRYFDGEAAPLGDEIDVNVVNTFMNQSEPEVVMDDVGNVLVAWSDWNGNDGELMGIFGRAFDAAREPVGDDVQLTVTWMASQWEPKGHARPGSGFVMGWSGEFDGDAFFRVFDGDGTPLGGEVYGNTFTNNAQIDTAIGVARDGRILLVYEDFGGYGGIGTGQNLFARLFAPDGTPLQPTEFLVNDGALPGNQKEPRVGTDGLGRFYIVYEDRSGDADGTAVYLRRYDTDVQPLGPRLRVNQTEAGDQSRADLAVDWVGNVFVTWVDGSGPASRAMIRQVDPQGAFVGDEVVVDDAVAGDQVFPSVDVDWAGEDLLVTFAAPGGSDGSNDIYARRFETVPLAAPSVAPADEPLELELDFPGGAGLVYVVLAAFDRGTGLPLPDGRTLALSPDTLFTLSLTQPSSALFDGFQGVLDEDGRATARMAAFAVPPLSGLDLVFAAVTLDPSGPTLIEQLRHVTDPVHVTVP